MDCTKKKSKSKYVAIGTIVVILSLAAYLSLAVSTVAGLSLLAVSPLLLCLGACGIMGGVIGGAAWFSRSKTKQYDSIGTDKKYKGCC
ncbi:MAG TPA: hypothetical protein VFU58_06320 [Candidatus Nitrosotalea sp.]|nr:hypothetical protein [Candidatus Nitrosotalea sp.]